MTFLRSRLFWIAAVVVVIAALLPFWLSAYLLGILTAAYYFGVFAMAWDLLFGFAGEVNFGPTFLIGLGAYTAAILNANYGVPIPVCVIAGAFAAVVGGILLAVPALRLRGPYFGLVTLVAVLLLQNFVVIFASVTGGEIGMTVPDVLSIDADVNYWYALAFLVVCAVLLFGLSRSAVGLILQASGQDAVERRRARLQCHQAQDRGLLRQRAVLGHRRRDADLLYGHRIGRHRGRCLDRGSDHHRRGARRPPDHSRRRLGRRVPHPRHRVSAAARPAQHLRRVGRGARGHPVLPRWPARLRVARGARRE